MAAPQEYPHGHQPSVLKAHATRTAANSCAYFAQYLKPGARILDLGCGPGTITVDLANAVGKSGYVLGVDFAADAIAAAQQYAKQELQQAGQIAFAVGDLFELDLPPASFDIVHAHQVLQHVNDPIGALKSLAKYCKPDGIIAVRDADYSGMFWYPENAGISRWRHIYTDTAKALGADPDAGRKLNSWAAAAGLEIISATTSTWTYTSAAERSWWGNSQADRVLHSAFAARAAAFGASQEEVSQLAAAWRDWAAAPTGLFCIPHGELIAKPRV